MMQNLLKKMFFLLQYVLCSSTGKLLFLSLWLLRSFPIGSSLMCSRLWQLRSPSLMNSNGRSNPTREFNLTWPPPRKTHACGGHVDDVVLAAGLWVLATLPARRALALLSSCARLGGWACMCVCVGVGARAQWVEQHPVRLRLLGCRLWFQWCSLWCVSFSMLPLPACIPLKKKVQYNTLFFIHIYFFFYIISATNAPHIAGYFRKAPFSAQYQVGAETAKEVLAAGVVRR